MTAPGRLPLDGDSLASELSEAAAASEDIALELERIVGAVETIMESGLTRRAIVILLRDLTGVGLNDIDAVLRGLQNLDKFLKSKE